jgi:hypothetical protein
VIVRQEELHVPVQGSLVENDDVVEALAANCGSWILALWVLGHRTTSFTIDHAPPEMS